MLLQNHDYTNYIARQKEVLSILLQENFRIEVKICAKGNEEQTIYHSENYVTAKPLNNASEATAPHPSKSLGNTKTSGAERIREFQT